MCIVPLGSLLRQRSPVQEGWVAPELEVNQIPGGEIHCVTREGLNQPSRGGIQSSSPADGQVEININVRTSKGRTGQRTRKVE